MDRKDLFILLLILIPSFLLRLYNLDFHNGQAVFDEKIYYRPASLSYLQKTDDPNFEHPPLGKEVLALGIKVFGDNPFGWRMPSLIFSLFGIVVVYFLFRDLSSSRFVGGLTSAFLSLDFMYFIHSRLGTMEIFYLFFLWSSMYFLFKFICINVLIHEYKIKFLVLGSIFFGLALSTKWTAILVLIPFLLILLSRKRFRQIFQMVAVIFLVSLVIYVLVYLPYLQRHSVYDLVNLQTKIFNFWATFTQKTKIKVTPIQYILNHAFAWPLNPAWAYDYIKGDNDRLRLVWAMYNPLLFFLSLFFFIKNLITGFRVKPGMTKQRRLRNFLSAENLPTLIILTMFLPWLFVTRIEYTYYFLPALPFLYSFLARKFVETYQTDRWHFAGLALTTLLVFAYFYPLITGTEVPGWYLTFYPLGINVQTNGGGQTSPN